MIVQRISKLANYQPILFNVTAAHSATCPTRRRPVCPGSGGRKSKGGGGKGEKPPLVRALRSGKCRMGFIPEEWFTLFSKKTGVSGPYFLLLGFTNYVCSKEIYVMEHEYYSGLSMALVLYLVVTRLGPQIGAALDKEVDAIHHSFQKGRDDDIKFHQTVIKESEMAMKRAHGQVELVAAKKENILLQLEAEYRDRVMRAYRAVVGRMTYHIRKQNVETRIHQRWMIEWILRNVRQSITPEFQRAALKSAISELTAMASRSK